MKNTNDNLSTKEKLLAAGVKLFSRHGYESTTSRLIAETAGTNVASMAFHFGNKEEFYYAVLNHVADKVRSDYSHFVNKVQRAHDGKTPTPERAWELIEEYVEQILSIVNGTNQKGSFDDNDVLNLLFREQIVPAKGVRPITNVLCKESEALLNILLMDFWQKETPQVAAIISRSITGAIISFGEHPTFIRRALGKEDDADLEDEIWDTLRDFILNSIKAYTPT